MVNLQGNSHHFPKDRPALGKGANSPVEKLGLFRVQNFPIMKVGIMQRSGIFGERKSVLCHYSVLSHQGLMGRPYRLILRGNPPESAS